MTKHVDWGCVRGGLEVCGIHADATILQPPLGFGMNHFCQGRGVSEKYFRAHENSERLPAYHYWATVYAHIASARVESFEQFVRQL